MSTSTFLIIIGLILGLLFGAVTVIWRQHYRDIFAGFLVVGILALAVIVTISQVQQYRTQKAEASRLAQSQPVPVPPVAGSGGSLEPRARRPAASPMLPMGGLRGAAAPPAAHSPYDGNP